jgi:hypothetical protein
MRHRLQLAVLALSWLGATSGVSGAEPTVVGTWRLVSNDEHRADGTVTPVWGPSPAGRLVYDAAGRMSVQLGDSRRRTFATEDRVAGTDDEVRQAFAGYIAYFGSYTVDAKAGVVTHRAKGSLFPNLIGMEQRRFFTLSGNTLTLKTPPLFRMGRTSTYVLVWEREGGEGTR